MLDNCIVNTCTVNCEVMWFLAVVVAFFSWYAVFRYRRRRLYELAGQIRGPPEIPLIGIAHRYIGNTQNIMDTLKDFSYFAINNDGISAGWLGYMLYFMMVDPVDIEVVLKTCLEKDDLSRFIRKIIGNGGIFAPVSIWRKRRKIMLPTFSPRIIDHFVEVFSEQSAILAQQLAMQHNAAPFPAWPYLSTYTLDSVGETTMGIKLNTQRNKNSPFL